MTAPPPDLYADVTAPGAVPNAARIAAASTFDAIRLGAAHNLDVPAIQFLPNASEQDTPIGISHAVFNGRRSPWWRPTWSTGWAWARATW